MTNPVEVETGWQTIGHVAVDTGTIVIADPCQVDRAADIFSDYAATRCEGTLEDPRDHIVFSDTGFGDGLYAVEVLRHPDSGRTMELRIKFIINGEYPS
jgi:hypothetical protein